MAMNVGASDGDEDEVVSTINTTPLVDRLKRVAVLNPQPEVQIRGDGGADYEGVGKVILAVQRAGITKVGFITEPPARGG